MSIAGANRRSEAASGAPPRTLRRGREKVRPAGRFRPWLRNHRRGQGAVPNLTEAVVGVPPPAAGPGDRKVDPPSSRPGGGARAVHRNPSHPIGALPLHGARRGHPSEPKNETRKATRDLGRPSVTAPIGTEGLLRLARPGNPVGRPAPAQTVLPQGPPHPFQARPRSSDRRSREESAHRYGDGSPRRMDRAYSVWTSFLSQEAGRPQSGSPFTDAAPRPDPNARIEAIS